MGLVTKRFEVYLIGLNPTQGHEISKTRPCVILSPDEMNRHIGTVIIAPLTTKGRRCPTRVPLTFQGKKGLVVLDQIRTVDKHRLVKRLGRISKSVSDKTLIVLQEMFAA